MSFGNPFGSPYFLGGASTIETPSVYPVALAGRGYIIDLAKFRWETIELLREPSDQGVEPGERSLSTLGIWRRYAATWHRGAGQEYFDDLDSDRARFWKSKGVDVWTERSLSLLPDTEQKRSSAATNLKLLSVGDYIYVADGTSLVHTTNPEASPPTFTTVVAPATITDIATDGEYVYVACGGSTLLQRTALGTGAMAAFSVSIQPDTVAYANGRLLVSAGARLAEVNGAGQVNTDAGGLNLMDYTHRTSAWQWTDIAGGPRGIYAAGRAELVSELYLVALSSTTPGALGIPTVATQWVRGEAITGLESYGGFLVLGTTGGVRTAAIDEAGGVSYGPLVEVASGVTHLDASGKFVYFGWGNYDSVSSGVGRLNLGEFTFPLLPAYASDVMTGDSITPAQGDVTGVVRHKGRTFFVLDGQGLYGALDNFVPAGSLHTGWITDGIVEPKIFTHGSIAHKALKGSVKLSAHFDDLESGISIDAGTSSAIGTTSPAGAFPLGNRSSEQMMAEVTLTRSSTTPSEGPTLRRVSVYSIPAPSRQSVITLPLILHPQVVNHHGVRRAFDPIAEYQFLKDLESSGQVALLQIGRFTIPVRVSRIALTVDKYAKDMSFFEGLVLVELLTAEV